jgi:hypothetical protein
MMVCGLTGDYNYSDEHITSIFMVKVTLKVEAEHCYVENNIFTSLLPEDKGRSL